MYFAFRSVSNREHDATNFTAFLDCPRIKSRVDQEPDDDPETIWVQFASAGVECNLSMTAKECDKLAEALRSAVIQAATQTAEATP